MLDSSVVDWLLASKSPSIRYRTRRELLDLPANDPQVQSDQALIAASTPVERIFAKMHPDGYWLQRGVGAGVDYSMSSSTHFVLAFLAELGLDRSHPRLARAAERYLSLTSVALQDLPGRNKAPDYVTLQSCLYAYNLRTFVQLGYRADPRVQERVNTLLTDQRFDGGYLCRRAAFDKDTKSCIRGSLKALTAFAVLPELWETPRCRQLVDYFLRRRVIYRLDRPDEVVRSELTSTIFPFVISASLLEALYALSVMGYGQHPALQPAWDLLETKKDPQGRYILDWYPPTVFNPGPKKQPNAWVTLYAGLALKGREVDR